MSFESDARTMNGHLRRLFVIADGGEGNEEVAKFECQANDLLFHNCQVANCVCSHCKEYTSAFLKLP